MEEDNCCSFLTENCCLLLWRHSLVQLLLIVHYNLCLCNVVFSGYVLQTGWY
uniref:Uncharacterized protein n=1 Tax=Arundo donax TaxID=35708 RepID=A0A0A9UC59_ARUDO